MPSRKPLLRAALLAAALVVLNASLTFGNIWPTAAIRFEPQLSIELAAALLVLAALGRRAVPFVSALWVMLVLGHYADVTAPALYGREVNLYWDLRLMPDVAAMVTRVAPVWLIVLCAALVIVALAALFGAARWAHSVVAGTAGDPPVRRALVVGAIFLAGLFAVDRARTLTSDDRPIFAAPVTETYARQVRLVARAMRHTSSLPPSPPMTSDLSLVAGADVLLVFVESYGAVSDDKPQISTGLSAARAGFERAIRDTRRSVVSAFVESPTFGGGSWLAHLSLISGIEVRDPDTNALLMTEPRDSLVRAFGRGGFRTVAIMPGLRQSWPEGRFYGFDQIDGAAQLDYRGPEFGWFAIPDQFSLARLETLEMSRASRPPLFVFFPTISTHFPFRPTPPYQADWRRMLTERPYDGPEIVRAYARQPDWTDFTTGYVEAISYDFETLAGFLRQERDRDLVMIVIGDHQPAAAVTGKGASWEVPVHIVSTRRAVIDRLIGRGFREGITPSRPSLGKMHQLLPILLDAFGEPRP